MIKKQPAKKVSRQRLWQRKQIANGQCTICTEPRVNGTHCQKHRDKQLKLSKRRYRDLHPNHKPHLPKAKWDAVDWSLPEKEIAKKLKQTIHAVIGQKRRRFKLVKTWVPIEDLAE